VVIGWRWPAATAAFAAAVLFARLARCANKIIRSHMLSTGRFRYISDSWNQLGCPLIGSRTIRSWPSRLTTLNGQHPAPPARSNTCGVTESSRFEKTKNEVRTLDACEFLQPSVPGD